MGVEKPKSGGNRRRNQFKPAAYAAGFCMLGESMTNKSALRSIPATAGRATFDNRFEVSSQVLAAGPQDTAVRVLAPLSGPHRGQIGVRVGRVLVYVANREALASFLDAWNEAAGLADQAFGPEMPPPVYKPRTSG
jgi:hypothetical protein